MLNESKSDIHTYNIWFLPAYYEMESFFQSSLYDSSWNVQIIPQKYWTSSAADGRTSWNIYRKHNGNYGLEDVVDFDGGGLYGIDRKNKFYMRQACIISEKQ